MDVVRFQHQIYFKDLNHADMFRTRVPELVGAIENPEIDQSVDGGMWWIFRFYTVSALTTEAQAKLKSLPIELGRYNENIWKIREYMVLDNRHKIEVWHVRGNEVFIPYFLQGNSWHHYSGGKNTSFYSSYSSQAAYNRIARNIIPFKNREMGH